jgi:ERCC4-type nuclease
MYIVFDEREAPLYNLFLNILEKSKLAIQITKKVIPIGDIVLYNSEEEFVSDQPPIVIIERKSLMDLLASIKDGRYVEQSHRLIHTSNVQRNRIVYLLEGMMSQLKTENKPLIYSSMTSLSLYKGFTVLRSSSAQETAELIHGIANKIIIEIAKKHTMHEYISNVEGTVVAAPASYTNVVKKNKKENITPENITEIMLCQIPGISSVISSAIVNKCRTMQLLIQTLSANPEYLDGLQYEYQGKMRKINHTAIDNLKKYLIQPLA